MQQPGPTRMRLNLQGVDRLIEAETFDREEVLFLGIQMEHIKPDWWFGRKLIKRIPQHCFELNLIGATFYSFKFY